MEKYLTQTEYIEQHVLPKVLDNVAFKDKIFISSKVIPSNSLNGFMSAIYMLEIVTKPKPNSASDE